VPRQWFDAQSQSDEHVPPARIVPGPAQAPPVDPPELELVPELVLVLELELVLELVLLLELVLVLVVALWPVLDPPWPELLEPVTSRPEVLELEVAVAPLEVPLALPVEEEAVEVDEDEAMVLGRPVELVDAGNRTPSLVPPASCSEALTLAFPHPAGTHRSANPTAFHPSDRLRMHVHRC
jgi:hypothetical protein